VTRLEVFGGDYERRQDVERLIILITDGVPTYDADKLDDEVDAVKRMGIRIIGLGVTHKVHCRFSYYDFFVHSPKIISIETQTKQTATYNCRRVVTDILDIKKTTR